MSHTNTAAAVTGTAELIFLVTWVELFLAKLLPYKKLIITQVLGCILFVDEKR